MTNYNDGKWHGPPKLLSISVTAESDDLFKHVSGTPPPTQR